MKSSKNSLSYFERQWFRQWWLILLLAGINLLLITGCIKQLGFGISWGNKPMNDVSLIIITIVLLFFTLWFIFLRLDVEIDKKGISWQFFLLEFKPHFLAWDEIEYFEVAKYNPMSFGGWGIKSNWKSKVYSTSGNYGLKLRLKNGRSIYIGTQHPEELNDVLNKIHVQR